MTEILGDTQTKPFNDSHSPGAHAFPSEFTTAAKHPDKKNIIYIILAVFEKKCQYHSTYRD